MSVPVPAILRLIELTRRDIVALESVDGEVNSFLELRRRPHLVYSTAADAAVIALLHEEIGLKVAGSLSFVCLHEYEWILVNILQVPVLFKYLAVRGSAVIETFKSFILDLVLAQRVLIYCVMTVAKEAVGLDAAAIQVTERSASVLIILLFMALRCDFLEEFILREQLSCY